MATLKIDPALLEAIQIESKKAATQVYEEKGTRWGVAETPTHTHNSVDSVGVPAASVAGFLPLPAQTGDILAPSTLGNQVVIQGNTTRGYGVFTTVGQPSFPIYPVPIISGGGSSTPFTLTGSPSAGAVSATLTAPYGGTTGTYSTSFSTTEVKPVRFTNGSASITWPSGLVYAAGTAITLQGDSSFHGGNAPLGTVVIFSAELSVYPQLWVRVDNGAFNEKWWGIDLDGYSIVGAT